MRPGWISAMMGLGLTATIAAVPFAAPNAGPVPFRRDRLPLDPDTQRRVAAELVGMASTGETETPEGRHLTARRLALALALDPTNAEARTVLVSLQEGRLTPPAADLEIPAHLTHTAAWLGSVDSPDARAFAACLADTLSATTEKPAGQAAKGAWAGWVPELAAYRPVAATVKPALPVPVAPSLLRQSAQIATPVLWIQGGLEEIRTLEVAMKATPASPGDQAGFQVQWQEGGGFALPNSELLAVLRQWHADRLPKARVTLSLTPAPPTGPLPDPSLSAAALVLVDAVVSGRETGGTVIGKIDGKGELSLPGRTAERLLAIADENKGGRVVLPREVEPWLPSLMVLTGPAFFLKHEILLAENARELVERATLELKGPASEAGVRFAELQMEGARNGHGQLGGWLVQRATRQRLAEIAQGFPAHASARVLLQQSAGDLPLKLSRPVLAAAISRGTRGFAGLFTGRDGTLSTREVEQAHEAGRKELERLERYASNEDRMLLDRYKELLQSLKALARSTRDAGDAWSDGSSPAVELARFKRQWQSCREDLAKVAE